MKSERLSMVWRSSGLHSMPNTKDFPSSPILTHKRFGRTGLSSLKWSRNSPIWPLPYRLLAWISTVDETYVKNRRSTIRNLHLKGNLEVICDTLVQIRARAWESAERCFVAVPKGGPGIRERPIHGQATSTVNVGSRVCLKRIERVVSCWWRVAILNSFSDSINWQLKRDHQLS